MSIIRWNPGLINRWPSIWDDDDFTAPIASNDLEVYETENEVVIKANVAGVKDSEVDITFEKGIVWIKAEKSIEEEDKKKKFYSKSSWSYSYKVAVPGSVDLTKEPSAEVEKGVLSITFQKAEVSKPKKLMVKSKQA